MSYTESVRKILLFSDLKKNCCRITELLVFTCFLCGSESFGDALGLAGEGSVSVKNEDLFSRIRFIASKLLGPEKVSDAVTCKSKNGPFGFYPSAFSKALNGYKEIKLSELDLKLKDPCCRAAALRAFFCCAGTVSSPEIAKCYVELYFQTREDAECCKRILADFSVRSGVSIRRNKYVCYVKNAEGISDFLTVTGAPSESIRFQVAKTGREVNNNVNRVTNCDLANIEKIRACSERERSAILKLRKNGLFYSLPEDLRDLAQFRAANPDLDHNELGALMNPRLSGSAVSRKMKQIIETAGVKK
ncbi:MAG: DNA-binding protein WhiA [Clostridia bacterium]|nr:DNA-binding protein WhiA [Clostridia bacterium]